MKAVILAAGKGVRLLPLTRDRPKPLLEVCGRPFMDYLIENLQESGISDFCFVIGYRKEKMIEYFVKRNVKCDIVFQKEQKGTGHAVGLAEDFVGGENFILAMGDNLYSVEDLRKVQKDDGYSYVVGKEVERPELYGVLSEGSGFLKEIKEKPKEPAGNLVNTGLYKLTPEIFRALEGTGKSDRGEYEFTDALNVLAARRKVKVIKASSFWIDMGSKEDLERIKGFISKIK